MGIYYCSCGNVINDDDPTSGLNFSIKCPYETFFDSIFRPNKHRIKLEE